MELRKGFRMSQKHLQRAATDGGGDGNSSRSSRSSRSATHASGGSKSTAKARQQPTQTVKLKQPVTTTSSSSSSSKAAPKSHGLAENRQKRVSPRHVASGGDNSNQKKKRAWWKADPYDFDEGEDNGAK
eukprot:COSAG06_NODE_2271_length_7201_cov_3.437623_1_plen_128_part_10